MYITAPPTYEATSPTEEDDYFTRRWKRQNHNLDHSPPLQGLTTLNTHVHVPPAHTSMVQCLRIRQSVTWSLQAFTATKVYKIFTGWWPCQSYKNVRRFRDPLKSPSSGNPDQITVPWGWRLSGSLKRRRNFNNRHSSWRFYTKV
jgi:hypothetical protein